MRNGCGEPESGKMSCHGKDLMEHVAYVSPLTFHGLSMDGTGAHYKDAFRIGLPFHLNAVHPDQRLPYRRLSYFPFHGHLGVCDYAFEPAFIRKRNERERHRVRCVNEGYARLREHLPAELEDKRLSKVETLRAAIDYIKHLQSLLEPQRARDGDGAWRRPGKFAPAAEDRVHQWGNQDQTQRV